MIYALRLVLRLCQERAFEKIQDILNWTEELYDDQRIKDFLVANGGWVIIFRAMLHYHKLYMGLVLAVI